MHDYQHVHAISPRCRGLSLTLASPQHIHTMRYCISILSTHMWAPSMVLCPCFKMRVRHSAGSGIAPLMSCNLMREPFSSISERLCSSGVWGCNLFSNLCVKIVLVSLSQIQVALTDVISQLAVSCREQACRSTERSMRSVQGRRVDQVEELKGWLALVAACASLKQPGPPACSRAGQV